MLAKLQSWWQRIKKPLEVAVIIFTLVVLIMLILVIIIGYPLKWGWTGISQKTLWDWLQLLIIPVVLAIGGYLFNLTISRNEQKIALDNQHEAALQEYIDKMSELLLEKQLRESQPEEEVQKIARVRTLTVLSSLDEKRKKSVLQFLHESRLIDKDKRIINLSGADIGKADLRWIHLENDDLAGVLGGKADLSKAHLSKAHLSGAHLSGANMSGADLSEARIHRADLSGVDLSGADLSGADLKDATGITIEELKKKVQSLQGAILPDGSIHQ